MNDPDDGAGGIPGDGPGRARPPGQRGLRDGVLLAVGTLTALPVPAPSVVDRAAARVAMLLAPAVAVLPGTVTALVAAASLRLGLGPLLAAALALGTLALLTRGLHLDGLADTADGLAASYDRDRALDVMRRGDTGPAGTATVVLVLAVQVAALAQALQRLGPVAALVAVVAARTALPLLCSRGVPPARPSGLGAAVAGSVPRVAAALVTVLSAAVAGALTRWPATHPPLTHPGLPDPGLPPAAAWALPIGVLAVVAATLPTALLARRAVRRFGGITGDVLGAGVELATAAALVVLAAVPVAT